MDASVEFATAFFLPSLLPGSENGTAIAPCLPVNEKLESGLIEKIRHFPDRITPSLGGMGENAGILSDGKGSIFFRIEEGFMNQNIPSRSE